MALFGRSRPSGQPPQSYSTDNPPYGDGPKTTAGDLALGTTAPLPEMADLPAPRVSQLPLGQSGRGNYYGLPQVDEINRRLVGVEGLRRFDEMYWTDPHIRRLILMAWAPIIAGTWTLEPYGGDDASDLDREVADTIWWAINDFMSPNLTEHLSTVGPVLLRSGFCPFEQIWATTTRNGKEVTVPRKLDLRLPRSIWKWWQDDYGELTHVAQILPTKADVVIPASELVYYRLAVEGDNWTGMSLLRHAYKPYVLKDKLERLQVIGIEHAASGVPIIYPPKGADPQVKAQVEQIFANMHLGDATYCIMPGPKAGSQGPNGVPQEEWLVEIVQYDSSGGAKALEDALKYHSTAIALSFAQDFMELGQHQVGARATAQVQEDPYLAAVDGLVLSTVVPPLNRLAARIADVNWGDKIEGPPVFNVSLHENASLSEISGYVQQLVAAGAMEPDPELEDHLRDMADLPPANADIRAAAQKAKMVGYDQAANPPDPIELIKAKAAAGAPPGGDAPPAAAKPAAKAKPAKTSTQALSDDWRENLREAYESSDEFTLERALRALAQDPPGPKVPSSAAKTLDSTPTARWFERLLSQDRLREAFDGARDNMQAQTQGPVLTVARQMAHQAANGTPMTASTPPPELVDALTAHYEALYHLGHDTVGVELNKQRAALNRQLFSVGDVRGAVGDRLARARQRGQHSARNIVAKINERLGRDQITGLKTGVALQAGAEQAATGQLRLEALANTAASINDGRTAAAMASSDVIGGYMTSCMDERSCDPCISDDDGVLLSPDDAVALGPPNPRCEGGDFCRCAIVWILSDDPAALQSVT